MSESVITPEIIEDEYENIIQCLTKWDNAEKKSAMFRTNADNEKLLEALSGKLYSQGINGDWNTIELVNIKIIQGCFWWNVLPWEKPQTQNKPFLIMVNPYD